MPSRGWDGRLKALGNRFGRTETYAAGLGVLGYPPTWEAGPEELELVELFLTGRTIA